MKELKGLKERLEVIQKLYTAFDDLEVLLEMAYEEEDAAMIPEIKSELKRFEAAYEILEKCGIHSEVMDSVVNASKKKLAERFPGAEVEVMIFSKTKGILGSTCAAEELLAKINSFELSEVDFGKIYLEEGAREASAGSLGAEE